MFPSHKLVISSISQGQFDYVEPFLLNNDAFPVLQNALSWRKRLIKKPGSDLLGRLQRIIGKTDGLGNAVIVISPTPILIGVTQIQIGTVVYTDPGTGINPIVLLNSSGLAVVTLDRSTGTLTISAAAPLTNVQYFPGLPVMGIETFESDKNANAQIDFPTNVFFDTTYSYIVATVGSGVSFFDNSFYKNSGALIFWRGSNFQQFFSSNYFRAMFVTNNNPGAQFGQIFSIVVGNPTTINTAFAHGLTSNDYVFINEVANDPNHLLNMQAFKVTFVSPTSFTVDANTTGGTQSGGIFQYLTRKAPAASGTSANTGDGIQWFDGQGGVAPGGLGFVNFEPPLDNLSSASTTYLVGARMVIPFGNRLLAIGTFEATSTQILAGSNGTYYGNRIRYCNVTATPFYTNGQTPADSLLPATQPPIPNPTAASSFTANQAWVSNIQGFGGFIDLDTTQRIISAAITQGSMILGMESEQRKMLLTGIETDPFSLQTINPDYGSSGTHSIIPMDKGILTVGEYGLLITSSYDAQRFDVPIIDQVFEINPGGSNNAGFERISGARDFPNEVVYFSFLNLSNTNTFPNQTIVYNYRENNFATWFESVTTYGIYKNLSARTWVSLTDFTWEEWDEPWQVESEADIFPFVAFGTPQGFIMIKDFSLTSSGPSLMINNIVGNTITSFNHNLSSGMYLGVFPTLIAPPTVIGRVTQIIDNNTFVLDNVSGIVLGTTTLSIIDQPFVQTKQFNFNWQDGRKIRIGSQRYFMEKTVDGEFTVQILGSQSSNPLSSLISNSIVRTRPDDSLGLNDDAVSQNQIWHRLSTSAIGDTIQLQMTFSDLQMRSVPIATSSWILHSIVLDLYQSSRTLA